MPFRLLGDRIAIIDDEETDTTPSGIILPSDTGKELLRYGTVAFVSEGRTTEAGDLVDLDVEEGDRVFFNRHSGSMITVEGTEYRFLSEREIIGIEEPEGMVDVDAPDPS